MEIETSFERMITRLVIMYAKQGRDFCSLSEYRVEWPANRTTVELMNFSLQHDDGALFYQVFLSVKFEYEGIFWLCEIASFGECFFEDVSKVSWDEFW